MNRWVRCAMVAGALAFAGCYDDMSVYPDSGYVVTAQPYYYQGRPAYYYGNRWVYRDGARWNHYRAEPPALRVARSSSVRVVGRTYERRR